MSFFRLRTTAGRTWPELPRSELSQLWLAYRALDESQWLDPVALQARQLVQVRTLLSHCLQAVPYYRQILTAQSICPDAIQTMEDFRRIPILPRQTYQQRFVDFEARSLPSGTVLRGELTTSGTSGVPIRVLQTNLVALWWLAFTLRELEWCGMDPRGTFAALRATGTKGATLEKLLKGVCLPYWSQLLNDLIETGRSYGMDIRQEPRRQLEWLRQVRPDYLLSFPSNLEFLASLVQEEGPPLPGLRLIQSISETLPDDTRRRIEAAFGVPVKNCYTTSEAGYVASPCPLNQGLHVHAENVVLEILDGQDRPCLPGQSGRVILTTLHNFRAPFVRYDIMDEATLAPQPCPCGRGLPLLTQVFGRVRPPFRLPDGRWKNSGHLVTDVRSAGGQCQHQVIQRSVDHVIVRIVPDHTWTVEHEERIRAIVQAFFESPVRIDIELQERLELSAGGKLSNVVCEIN